MSDVRRFNELFDYHSAPEEPPEALGVLVFGRHDLRLPQKMGSLATRKMAKFFVVSGALGKDSGYLWKMDMPEADFVAAAATAQPHNVPGHMILRERKALNGGENARLGLGIMDENKLSREEIIALCHATSLRRLAATAEKEGSKLTPITNTVYRVPTDYPFDPRNPIDQYEAVSELIKLYDGDTNGFLDTPDDFPIDLLEFALETKARMDAEGGPIMAYEKATDNRE